MIEVPTKRQTYEYQAAALRSERASFESHWRELADFCLPTRLKLTTSERNRGQKRNQNIINGTAMFAAGVLESGMHAGITSPARPWFRLTTPDPELAKRPRVERWLSEASDRLHTVFHKSNLYTTLPQFYSDMGVFGTAAMSVLEDDDDVLRCYSYPVGSYALGTSNRGVVDTCTREWSMTVHQLLQEFGYPNGRNQPPVLSVFSQSVRDLIDKKQWQATVDVCWIVCPNEDYDEDRLGTKYLRYSSCYFERGTGAEDEPKFLRESGFNEFPIMAARWKVSGEDIYATDCPGMRALGDVRQLQIQEKRKGQAIEKGVNPPLQAPPDVRSQRLSQLPGDVTYVNQNGPSQGVRTLHEVNLNLDHLVRDMDRVEFRINTAFYVDLFRMLAQRDSLSAQPLTAREVAERHEEKLMILGPMLERCNEELLKPLVDRGFAILERKGLLPDAPEELSEMELKVEYQSVMHDAQKLVKAAGVERFVQGVAYIVQSGLDPQAGLKVDTDALIDSLQDMNGVDPKLVRSKEEAAALREQAAQAMAAQAEAEQIQRVASGAAALSQASLEGDTALSRIASAAGEAAA